MTDITIPPAALEAAAKARYEKWAEQTRADEKFDGYFDGYAIELLCLPWSDINEDYRAKLMEQERAACLAMIKAWPGMKHELDWDAWLGERHTPNRIAIILPLPQEPTND